MNWKREPQAREQRQVSPFEVAWYVDRLKALSDLVTEHFTPLAHERIVEGQMLRVRHAWRRRHDERRHNNRAALRRRNRIAMAKASRRRNRAA